MRPGKRGTRSSPSPGKSTSSSRVTKELAAIVGYDDSTRVCAELAAEGVLAVVVKGGSKGAIVGLPDSITTVAPPAIVVDDATGAGDTFCGGLTAGLALGEPLLTAGMRGAATARAALGRAAPSACYGGK
jgi:ribokinase